MPVSGSEAAPASPIHFDEAQIIVIRIDSQRHLLHQTDRNAATECQGAKLFQFFQFFQLCRGRRRVAKQERSAIAVQSDVLEEASRLRNEIRLAVANKRDRTAAEVERPTGVVADYLDAIGIVPRFESQDRTGERG